jgi:stage II sporulation protein D
VKGAADDRSAAVYAWEVRKTRKELEEAIGKRVRVGTLRDLKVVKRGQSGRIVTLEVVGSRGRQTVRGFDVRNLLDLRETLAAFEIQRDRGGEITAVAFHGKGWGHGVGLCQVGAYGMALRGEGYRSILAHYYPGTTVSSAP